MASESITRHITEEGIVDLLCQMIRFDTTNPPGNEKPLAEMLAKLLGEHGFITEVTDLGNNRANFTARLKGTGERKALMFNGHLDVVPVGQMPWKHPAFDPLLTDGKIFGRGTSDMKSGLASMIIAAIAIKQSGLPLKGDLVITGSADEESGSIGAKHYLENVGLEDIGAIIVGEPSSCNLNVSEKGALWVEVATIGKTAHGAFPERGINAILGMNAFISKFLQYKPSYTPNGLLGHPSMNISMIQGGVKANVVPDRCAITIDFRTVPGMQHSDVVNDMKAICAEIETTVAGLQTEVTVLNDRPAVETAVNHPFVALAQEVIQAEFKRHVEPMGVNFYTDAAIFLPGTDIPAILYGPGESAMAHQPNEYVPVPQLSEATCFYAAMAERYLIA